MNKSLIREIHNHIRESRRVGTKYNHTSEYHHKRYERMPQIPLDAPGSLALSLEDALRSRISSRNMSVQPLHFEQLSQVFGHALSQKSRGRPYPSGGGFYPIETYLVVESAVKLERGAYHYRPDTHAFEFLWPTPPDSIVKIVRQEDLQSAQTVVVLTAHCDVSEKKYKDFALELALLEAGHMMQNLQLVATAIGLGMCSYGGFSDEELIRIFDLPVHEFPIYSAVLGVRA